MTRWSQRWHPRMVWALIAGMVTAGLLGGCGGTEESASSVGAEASTVLPVESLEDVVSYGDAVVVMEVTEEQELAPTPEELESGEGAIMREVTVVVRDTLWRRVGAPAVPTTFEFVTWGWAFDGADRTPMGQAVGDRLEVGGQFLAPIVDFDDDGWGPFHPDFTFGWTGSATTGTTRKGTSSEPEALPLRIADELTGRSEVAIIQALTTTEPDPLAARYADLDPEARYQAVADAKRTETAGG